MLKIDDKTYSIYCVYHNEKLREECNLDSLDKQLYSLYYTQQGHDKSLDHIQQYICEFTAQYFVWKNQIKTDYVGFCQYHRVLNVNFEDFVKNNCEAVGFTWGNDCWSNFEKYRFNGFLQEDMRNYIIKNYKKKDRIYKYFITEKDKPVPFYINEIYMCKWEYFNEIVGFISGFIDYIDKEYNLNGDPQEWHYFILDNFIDIKLTKGIPAGETSWWFEQECRNFWRVVANWIELCLGVYFGHLCIERNIPIHELPSPAQQQEQQQQNQNIEQ